MNQDDPKSFEKDGKLYFGVDSQTPANTLLQNNLSEFEWVLRNKVYPCFWGRNVNGRNSLTKEEIKFIHRKGCKIAPMYSTTKDKEKQTYAQGQDTAKEVVSLAVSLDIPAGTAFFHLVDADELVTTDYMSGYINELSLNGLVPGFKANTDAKYTFDREFSRGMQVEKDSFKKGLIWATSPILEEYNQMTTTHLIKTDNWQPFAPSGIRRTDIAIWQYGDKCHSILDNNEQQTFFNLNLVKNRESVFKRMF